MTAGQRIVAVMATEEHAAAVAAFYRETWDAEATTDSVLASMRLAAAENVASPGESPPTALVVEGSRVLGYCGSIPQRLWDGAEQRPAYWVKGLMVLPEYRNGPIGYMAVKELTRHLPRATILTVAPGAKRLFAALGYQDLGALTNWVKPLDYGVIAKRVDLGTVGLSKLPKWIAAGVTTAQRTGLASIAASIAGVGVDAATAFARISGARFDTTIGVASRHELDALWRSARGSMGAAPVRDGRHLETRFGQSATGGDTSPYRFVLTREQGRLVGAAVLRRPAATSDPRLGGIRMATISDILFPTTRADAGLATLGAIARAARASGAHAITAMTCHPSLTALLVRQGYLRLAGNVHFFLRDVTGEQWPTDLDAWWLARGDGESDATF